MDLALKGKNDGKQESCTALAMVGQQMIPEKAALANPNPPGQVGVRVVGTSATFDYLYVLQLN